MKPQTMKLRTLLLTAVALDILLVGNALTLQVTAQVGAKERLKAAEMLAKVRGLFVTKQEIDLTGNVPVVIRDDI